MTRPRTIADRCRQCVLQPRKDDPTGCRAGDERDFDRSFRECVNDGTPFWCHDQGTGTTTEHYDFQVCRAWLAIMERKWRREELVA